MPRTTEITLDGATYVIRAFNIGELEEIAEAGNSAWKVLKVALRRAQPPVADPNIIEPTPAELTQAFGAIMKLAGLEDVKAGPQLVAGTDTAAP